MLRVRSAGVLYESWTGASSPAAAPGCPDPLRHPGPGLVPMWWEGLGSRREGALRGPARESAGADLPGTRPVWPGENEGALRPTAAACLSQVHGCPHLEVLGSFGARAHPLYALRRDAAVGGQRQAALRRVPALQVTWNCNAFGDTADLLTLLREARAQGVRILRAQSKCWSTACAAELEGFRLECSPATRGKDIDVVLTAVAGQWAGRAKVRRRVILG